jgi:aryl-alcohol dehydrogenase-like predicted oxidoreductase
MTTSLPTTRLGRTGMELTRVGFGAWAIGGGGWAFAWGCQDDAESIAAIRAAVESGVNWIDTAAVYGLGHSEEVVATALAGFPESDRPYVFTKGGLVWDPAHRTAAPRRVGAPASLRAEVEASLRRLRVDRIDLYQMHWPAEDGTPVEEYWQVFADLKREGKVRAIGLSNHYIWQLDEAEGIAAVDAIQPQFSLIHRDAANDVLLWAHEHHTGVIVYSPMASGLLTGAFTAARAATLDPGDWRRGHPDFTEPALTANLALAHALDPVAERHGVSPAAIAVAWTLSFPAVTGAIVGGRTPQQVSGWLPAATLELKEDDLAEIAAAIHATGAGTGPATPPAAPRSLSSGGLGWAGRRLPVGSSARSTPGFLTRARTIATRCCWPPDSSEGRCPARSSSPTSASACLARSFRCPASGCSGTRAASTFS